jgi:hypothetical protein
MAEIFGTLRSPKSLGLAGMMRAEARIFHEVLFDLNGIGRISDLFAVRLRRALPDELEFRASILFGVVDSHRFVTPGSPIRVECGLDNEKLGISVVFTVDPERPLKSDGLRERVIAGKGGDRLEQMLHSFLTLGERVFLKYQPATGLAEVCLLIAQGRGAMPHTPRAKGSLEVIILPAELEQSSSIAEYTALGDIDYRKLLKSTREASDPLASPTGEVLLHAAKDSAGVQESIRLKRLKLESPIAPVVAKEPKPEPTEVVIESEPPQEEESETRVSGVTQKIESDESKIVVSGESLPHESPDAVVVSASRPEPKPEKKSFLGGLFSVFKRKPEREQELPKVLETAEYEKDPAALLEDSAPTDAAAETAPETAPETADETLVPVAAMRELHTIVRDLESATDQGALSRLIDRMEREKNVVKNELKNSKAEKWIEGLAGELVAERARLTEMAKKLTQSVRQKELEFKNRENSLIQSVRTRDENLRSKTLQLMRMKDQVAKLQMSVERAKHSAGSTEETASKIKLTQTQRLLQASKGENEQLNLKLQDLKIRLEQVTEQKKLMVSASTHAELQKKVESLSRQIEELKRSSAA